MPVGLVKNDAPSSVIALRLTSANRTRSSTWLLGAPSCSCSSGDDFFLLVDVAGGDVDGLLDRRPCSMTVPDSTTFLPLLCDVDRLAGKQLLHLLAEPREVALHDRLRSAERAGAVPDEHRDRAGHLAVDEQLVRRRDQRVGDVGARQRHARDRRADVDDRRAARRAGARCSASTTPAGAAASAAAGSGSAAAPTAIGVPPTGDDEQDESRQPLRRRSARH